jgi:hypothetical protein
VCFCIFRFALAHLAPLFLPIVTSLAACGLFSAPPFFFFFFFLSFFFFSSEAFCDGDWAIENLYPYLAREHANEDYRKQVMLRELRHFAADIICMQEVSRPLFDTYVPRKKESEGKERREHE